jgi:hypothetical protein
MSQLHHYVPRFLLRRFGAGKKEHVHAFDKSNGGVFSRAAGKLAANRDFYDFEFMGKPMTVEPALADVEAKAGKHIARIIKERRLRPFDPEERGDIAQFLAVQLVRTPADAATRSDMAERMEGWLRENGMAESFFDVDPRLGNRDNAERAMMARRIINAPSEYSGALLEKDWVLFEAAAPDHFLIGDHPLVMHNSLRSELRGNIGLSVEGIEIYIPLSPSIILGLLCPSLRDGLTATLRSSQSRTQSNVSDVAHKHVERLLAAMGAGVPMLVTVDETNFFNSLQVAHAERFVFSSDAKFDLVKSMLAENLDLKRGRRIREATGKF